MSEPDSPTRRGELHHHHQQQQLHQSVDERDEANNSIIGKVRSRVSSIFPQQLTKWFSPAAATSNGGVGGASRRRRRNEEDDHDRNSQDDNDSEASDHSGGEDATDEYSSPALAQPPCKRSRLNIEVTRTNFKNSESLVASTPAMRGRQRLSYTSSHGKPKEPAYNFGGHMKLTTTTSSTTTTNTLRSVITTSTPTVDSADIIEVVPERNVLNTSISSRRSLNIPSSSSNESHRLQNDFKRRTMLSIRTPIAGGPSSYQIPQSSAAAIIAEGNDDDDANNDESQGITQTINERDEDIDVEDEDDDDENDESEEIAKATSKKPNFTNGNRIGRSSSIATESGESRSSSVAQQTAPAAKPGLFNQANRGLRTMSGNGLNFYSHLEGRKSLFSEKNMPGMLNNSTLSLTSLNRRQFNSSIYGSTSALSDSRLLNTSSPFYKGQTTYGGAAAYSKLNQSVRIAPTLIRPTSSLSTLSSSTNSLAQGNDQTNSTAISSTAKRILELINDFSTPLNDAKKMASNIKTPGLLRNAATGKRFSEVDLATARSVRLSSVRKPYTRPAVTLNPNNNNNNNDSKKLLPPLKELQVPSMSQLLQMKKMQNCTERSRQIANTSKSALNRDCEYKLPFDEDDGHANTAAQKSNSDKGTNKQSTGKIKNKVTASSRVSSKNTHVEDEEPPAPVNLPNIAFPFMQSAPKIDIAVKSSGGSSAPQKPKTDFKFAPSSDAKPTNNFSFGSVSKQPEKPTASTEIPKAAMNFSFTQSSSTALTSSSSSSSAEFKFSSPVSVSCTPSKSNVAPINNFKFSSPVMVENKTQEIAKQPPAFAAVPQLKTGSVLDALKKPVPKTADTPVAAAPASSFGDMFKKPANEWECSACMLRNKETLEKCAACETPRVKPAAAAPAASLTSTNSFPIKNTFGEAFKPKSDTWECSACMVRNKNEANECVACCTKKPGASGAAAAAAAPAAKLETTDAGFKSLVAQQKASKWECDACMTRNDAERNKCVCCEQAKPGTQVVSDSVPQFSFGASSASKFTFGFGGAAAAAAKKEDELKAAAAAVATTSISSSSKTENKTGFTFGMPTTTTAKTNDTASSSISSTGSTTGFSFGIKPIQAQSSANQATTSKDVPDVVKTNTTTGFKFGVPSSSSSTSAAESIKSDTTTASTGFSFGLKPITGDKTIPASTATESSKANSAVTSTTTTPATTSLRSPNPQPAFWDLKKIGGEEPKPANTKSFSFGTPDPKPPAFNAQAAAAVTQATTEASKTPPKVTFGSFSTASSAVSTSTPSSTFVFGKPTTGAAAAASSAFAPKAASTTSTTGFSFGKDQSSSSSGPSLFGSVTGTGGNVSSKSDKATPLFGVISGNPTATPTASTAAATVSSSTTGFVFGKPATTSLFGAPAAPSTSTSSMTPATSSMFGSKPATTLFSAPAAVSTTSPSMPISTITSSGLSSSTGNASSSAPSPAPFVFGSSGGASSAANTNKTIFGASSFGSPSTAATPAAATPASNTSSWPTNSFTFGSTKPPEEPKTNALSPFGSTAPIFGQTTSMFGSAQPQQQQIVGEVKPMAAAAPSTIPSFGAPSATSTIFGSSTATLGAGTGLGATPSSNIFGSASSTPVFGSAKPAAFEGFGAPAAAASAPAAQTNNNTTNPAAMPTFGSSSAFSSGFGSLAASSSFSASSDGAPAPKKADMAFNFGGAQPSANTGFSFGANNNKPASDSVFKFSTTSTPSFNFTGTSESTNVAQPFQFGAPTSTPAVFNFGGVEGSNSGGPFQFNAAAPTAATNNIFAPMPTPGIAGSQQAARRKIRTLTRRTQPR